MASSNPHYDNAPGKLFITAHQSPMNKSDGSELGGWPSTPAPMSVEPHDDGVLIAEGQCHPGDIHYSNEAMEHEDGSAYAQRPSVATTAAATPEDESEEDATPEREYAPIAVSKSHPPRHELERTPTEDMTGQDLARILSQRRTNQSGATSAHTTEEQAEINRLMSKMFGQGRQGSEEERTRHVGVVFKNLTVKGVGLGAALQPTIGDLFLGLPRAIGGLFTRKKKLSSPVRTILNDFSGVIRPGEMVLVLGRPGSGCSTFLKVLGNQRAGYKSIEGEVTYGGLSAEQMQKEYRGEVLYNPEDDLHYATLSVQRTLEFALKTRTPGKESRLEGETRKEYMAEFLKTVTQLFWISHTLKTFVGDEHVRGVSGGERKRVSIAEAMITKASTQMWDNSTKGLDASTALEYVNSIRSLTNMAQISTAVALYQAGESLYKAFDKVLLIHDGRCCYFGSADDASAYFEGLGFERPARWTTADFLTSVTDEHAHRVKSGWEDRIPRSAEQFEEAFKKSAIAQRNLEDIADFESTLHEQTRERDAAMTKATKKKNYTLPFHKQVIACTQRQFLVMIGDRGTLIGKWGGILFQGLIVGSLFYDMPKTSMGVFPRGGVLFFMLLFNALLALAELTSAFVSRPILLKHKSFSFYRPSAYAIAQVMVDLPLVAVQVIIFDVVVYFMANLQRTASQFFISLLFLWTLTLSMYSFFRAIGAWTPSLDVATRFTGLSIQILVVYTGYLIPPAKMHPWFSWLRWVNPVQYGFEGLLSNEFYNLDIQCVPPMLVPALPNAQAQYQSCTIQGSQPGMTTVLGADYIEVAYQYSRAHLWRNLGIIIGFWLFFVVVTAIGMEFQKPNAGGGAVTVFKRGQAPKSVTKSIEAAGGAEDEEKGKGAGPVPNDEKEEESSASDNAGKGVAANETVFTFQNVNYTIPFDGGERQLLQNVNGYVRPGHLTALMGSSGAGKTTLLNTLAQRINFGVITGDFLVDGRPLPKSFQRSTGFAEQMDIHEPTATVREAFRFSALLRQPKEVPIEEKYEYVERIIDLLEMRDIAGATIGTIGSGLNAEQRKRVTIGVELASKPELLLFLDEPTSGLDSQAAFNIVRFLRKLADAGQAILCTIHQPSAVLFEEFDELILLKSGGRLVYHGPLGKDSRNLIDYFEGNGAKKCPKAMNPAEYMLEAIGAGDPNYKGQDWAETWGNSKNSKDRLDEIQQLLEERRSAPSNTTKDDREYAMPLGTQIWAVVKRCFIAYWRTPEYMIGKFVLHIVTGLFNTFTFWKIGNSQIDMQSRLFTIFITLTISPPLIQQLQPRYLAFRQVYQSRESNSKIYSWVAFVIGAILPELPYSFIAGTVYWNCWYWGVGFPPGFTAVYVWLMIGLFELFYIGFGQAIASFAANELLASLYVPFFFLFVVSFCGVVVPYASLPYFWQSWMYWLTPFHYLLEGLLAAVTHNVPVICADNEFARYMPPPGQTCESYTGPFIAQVGGYVQTAANGMCEFCQFANGDQFAASFNVFYSHIWRDYGIFWAYIIFNFAFVFACSWLYLGGARKLWSFVSPAARKARALKAKQQSQA